MSWKTALVTFGLIFFAELGDKTQLTTMLLAAQSRSPAAVFLGAALALVLTSLLGVAVGTALLQVVPQRYIHLGAGVAFIILGFLLISSRI